MIDRYNRISALFISDFANFRPYCNTVSIKPVVTVKDTPGETDRLLHDALELTVTVPLGIITAVVAVGTLLQLQLPAVSQLVFTAPVQVLVTQGLL